MSDAKTREIILPENLALHRKFITMAYTFPQQDGGQEEGEQDHGCLVLQLNVLATPAADKVCVRE